MIIIIIVAVILVVTLLVLFIICKYVRRRKQKKAMDKEGGKIRAIINQRSIDTPISGSTNPNAFATENENQMVCLHKFSPYLKYTYFLRVYIIVTDAN